MEGSEENLSSKSLSEEEEKKESQKLVPSLSPPDPASVDPVQSDITHAYIEILDKEFQKLALEESDKPVENENREVEVVESVVEDEDREVEVVESVVVDEDRVGERVQVVNEVGNGDAVEDDDDDENGEGEKNEKCEGGEITVEGKEKGKKSPYPSRPSEPGCVFYVKTGTCGFGSNCKFNHPRNKKHKVKSSSPTESEESVQVVEEKAENPKRVGRLECKYYLTPGGCKFGKACRYHHPRERVVVEPPGDFNFLGLPIRPGARECPFYMRTGSCKFATSCRYNHPDPTAGGSDFGYDRSSSVTLQSSNDSQSVVSSWSIPPPSTDNVPFSVPAMIQPQRLHSSLEWNEFQASVFPLFPMEGTMHPPMTSVLNSSNKTSDGYLHHIQQLSVDGYPERPGQKECQYYMNTGDCKYKSACRFHHPKTRVPKSSSLSPLGLPLRPDQVICSHFSRYGICKYGAACKYDHTPNPNSPASPLASPLPYYHNSAAFGGANYGDGSKSFVQQYV